MRFYKLNTLKYTSLFGLNLYHSAIELDDVEYYYEGNVQEINPKSYRSALISHDDSGLSVIKEFKVGTCKRSLFYSTLNKCKSCFTELDYNILYWNCNHFTLEFLKQLFDDFNILIKDCILSKLFITTGNFWQSDAFNKLTADYSIKLERNKNFLLTRKPMRLRVIKTTCCTNTDKESDSTEKTSDELLNEGGDKSKVISLKMLLPNKALLIRNSTTLSLSHKVE